jgi:putative phosphoesterase
LLTESENEVIGILSDAHGNHAAFILGWQILSGLGATRFVYLGDAVGYIPSADVITSLMEMGDKVLCIKGNHELMLLSAHYPSCQESCYRLQKTAELLSVEEKSFVSSWPEQLRARFSAGSCLFLHGSPHHSTNGYIYPDTDLSKFKPRSNFVFMGHSHRPFIRRNNDSVYVNVGSCGLPRDDGRYGSIALFDPAEGDVRLLRYDISSAIEKFLSGLFDVHPSVIEIFQRRSKSMQGDIIEF